MSSFNQDDDASHLLSLLHAHGQSFLTSFDTSAISYPTSNANDLDHDHSNSDAFADDNSEDEWRGIGSSDDPESGDDGELASSHPQVTVFDGSIAQRTEQDKASKRAFMSSKISRLAQYTRSNNQMKQGKVDEEAQDDLTNMQNDALLHKLVHTKLLSGSLNSELDLTPAQRRKALSGRVLELAGSSSLGKGEKRVREAERNHASKRVREGMLLKQKSRDAKMLEEAKELGNYHPTLKNIYSANDSQPLPKKRQKGLKMGVGRFSGGVLKLTQRDIAAVTGSAHRGKGTRGRGRKRS